jgi:hypothetical protein
MIGFDIHMVSNRCSMKFSKNLNFCLGLSSGLVSFLFPSTNFHLIWLKQLFLMNSQCLAEIMLVCWILYINTLKLCPAIIICKLINNFI